MPGKNNALDIRYRESDKWIGADDPPSSPDGFCNFTSIPYGIRAGARQLVTNQDRHDCATMRDQITRWAPPSENDTAAYIRNVATWSGIDPDAALDVHTYAAAKPLLTAMIREEGVIKCTPAQVDEGLKLAGIMPAPPKSAMAAAAKDPKVIAATIAATAATAQGTISSISGIWDSLSDMGIEPRYLVWACVAAVVGLGIYYVATKIKAHHEGTT